MDNNDLKKWLTEQISYLEKTKAEPDKFAWDPEYDFQISAFRLALERLEPVGPLTLEQLREMVDKPAYLYIYNTALDSGWHIIKAVTKDKIIFRGWNTVYVPISSIGKCFDLYAYPPAHIDREAWGSCDMCNRCGNCAYCMDYDDCAADQKREDSQNCTMFSPAVNYCWKCGRPLKPEAWAELEKRLMG